MLKYLEDKYGDRATQGDKSTLMFMRSEATRLEELVNEKKEKDKDADAGEKSEKGSEMETDEDVSILPHTILAVITQNRIFTFLTTFYSLDSFFSRTKTITLTSCQRHWPRRRSRDPEPQCLQRPSAPSTRKKISSQMLFKSRTPLNRPSWRELNRPLCSQAWTRRKSRL